MSFYYSLIHLSLFHTYTHHILVQILRVEEDITSQRIISLSALEELAEKQISVMNR